MAQQASARSRATTVPDLVAEAAVRFGDAEAVVDGAQRLSFTELAAETDRVAGAFAAAGVRPGDRVALWAPNSLRWVTAALGALRAGAVVVPLSTRLRGPEVHDVLDRTGAVALVTVTGVAGLDLLGMLEGQLADLPALALLVVTDDDAHAGARSWPQFLAAGAAPPSVPLDPDAVADIIFTSGTTGRPKGVLGTHAQNLRVFATWAEVVGLTRGDRYLLVNPFSHTFGLKAGIYACLMTGATMLPVAVFELDAVGELIVAEQVSVLPGPPTIYTSLLEHPRREQLAGAPLRLAVTGAAVVPVELIARMREELGFTTVLTAYGLTESTGTVTMCRQGDPAEVVSGSSGRAIPDVEVIVVDADGAPLPPGQAGEVWVRGYNVTRGYSDDGSTVTPAADPQGWLHTGDVGVLDAAGNLTITDRIKDMFIAGGFNAYPAEIELTLGRHPAVREVAVIGVPDARLGEVGHAFVVPRGDPPDPGELRAWAKEQMAAYKVPRDITFTEALPRNALGKVVKDELRARAREGAGT